MLNHDMAVAVLQIKDGNQKSVLICATCCQCHFIIEACLLSPWLSRIKWPVGYMSAVWFPMQIHLRQFDKTEYSALDVSDCKHSADQLTAETCVDEPTPATAAATACVW